MILLRLHLRSPFSGTLDYCGVPLRAAFLNLLREHDQALSDHIHGLESVRSYSLDPFPFDSHFQTHFDEGRAYDFGVCLFDADMYESVLRQIALNPYDGIRIHHYRFGVERINFEFCEPHVLMEEWGNQVAESISQEVRVWMDFLTPTQLSQFGSDMACLLPSPEKVFPGLLRVWNTVHRGTGLERVGEYRDWVERNVYLAGHRLRTVKVPLGRKRTVVGFIGKVLFIVPQPDDPIAALTYGLAKFAEMCNVGKNRTAGLGKVRTHVEYSS